MYDLDRQLSDLATFIDGAVEPVTASDVVVETAPAARRPRRAGLSLVFAVLVAVAIGVVIVVAPLGDQEPGVVDEPAPTVVSTTLPADPVVEPTVPPDEEGDASAVVPAPAYTWTRVDDPDLGGEGSQSINSIRAVRSGLMAVGSDNDRPAIWYSDDGLDWTRLEDTTGAFGPEYSAYGDESVVGLTDVADNGSRMVAVGTDVLDRTGVSSPDNPEVSSIAIWYSDDGTTWTRVPHDDTFSGSGATVSSTGIGFVVVGDEAIWTSPDGVVWTRSEGPGGAEILATDTGMLLVGGVWSAQLGRIRPAAWYSTDGQSWSAAAVETPTASDDPWPLMGVTRAADGFLAFSRNHPTPSLQVWFSEDGYSWTYRGGYSENDGYERKWLSDIAATGDTVIVAGKRGNHSMGSGATLWISTDGAFTWSVVEECNDPAGLFGNARSETRNSGVGTILATDGRFIVGGWFGGGTETDGDPMGTHDAAVWIGTPTDS